MYMSMFMFMHSSKHIQVFMSRLMELITADSASSRVPYDRKELALEYIVQVMCNDSITLNFCVVRLYTNYSSPLQLTSCVTCPT